jgi:hypothetical protein
MQLVLIVTACAVVLFAIDRLASWAESRGWIYWRRRKASPGTRAGAMLEIQSLLEPGKRHVRQAHGRELEDEDDAGDGWGK